MEYVVVKAIEGRIARTSKHGEFIPSDRYVRVEYTAYIKRLLDVHGDIVQEPATQAPAPEAAPNLKKKEI
jgi:hypothetical protein